jgi:8-oxo-dGTP pyrophosphatase MutT (NUDIX family)
VKPAKAVGIQYAALPYRMEGRQLRILLVTSRETRRWVIPKGWPMRGLKPQDAAAVEASEEAGLVGVVDPKPLGSYRYLKRLKGDQSIAVQVIVFAFHVQHQAAHWKEQDQRAHGWFGCRKAASLVAEPSLKRLIREFGASRTVSTSLLRRYRAWRFGFAG